MNLLHRMTGFTAVLLTLGSLPALAAPGGDSHDYPTVDRVEYVHICQRDNADRPPHEMLYKCSCVIDALAQDLTYDEFVEGSTAFYAFNIAGERGQVIRNEATSRGLADRFKSLQIKAKRGCFVEK